MLPIAHILSFTFAASPMEVVFETAEPGLRVWWIEGDLIVAPPLSDPRPALRPLVGLAPMHLPDKMVGWTPLGPDCSGDPTAEFSLYSRSVQAHWVAHESSPSVEIRAGQELLLTTTLRRPVTPCAIVAADIDNLPGLELLVLWEMASDPVPTRGLSVLRIPPMVP